MTSPGEFQRIRDVYNSTEKMEKHSQSKLELSCLGRENLVLKTDIRLVILFFALRVIEKHETQKALMVQWVG